MLKCIPKYGLKLSIPYWLKKSKVGKYLNYTLHLFSESSTEDHLCDFHILSGMKDVAVNIWFFSVLKIGDTMGCSKSSSKREVYSNIILPQETRNISNKQPNLTPKAIRERRTKPPQS